MSNPLVTVVIPIYNVEAYLDRCIESVVSQTYRNLEIILVDDGSPDNCPVMCDAWAKRDDRIRVIHKVNAGLGMARNTGIDHASGEYIFFFDSDDYVDPQTVESCVTLAERESAEVVMFGSNDAYEDGRIVRNEISPKKTVYRGTEILQELLPGLFTYRMGFGISACMKMFRTDVLLSSRIRFMSEREVISEDAFFMLELFPAISAVAILNENYYYYYKRINSLTATLRLDRQEKNNLFLQQSLAYAEEHLLPLGVKEGLTIRYHMYTMTALRQMMLSDAEGKKEHIYSLMKDPCLAATLKPEVLCQEKKTLRLFFSLLRCKFYSACYGLLYLRTRL